MTEITKELMDSITEAYAGSLFVRALLENQLDIGKAEKLRIDEIENITDRTMDLEIEKYRILQYFLSKGVAPIVQVKNDLGLSEFIIMKNILLLVNEGWLELRSKENLTYGVKTRLIENGNHLELELISPWNIRSIYDPIKIIVDANLCCLCGACKAVCPVDAITITDDHPIIDEEKCIHCGLCHFHCPRTYLPLNILKTFIAGPQTNYFQDLNVQPFGPYKIITSAQTTDERIKQVCQDGGMVTTFLKYLLEKKEIDGAVVAKRQSNSWDTNAVIVTNVEELLEAAGTKYAVSPNFVAFNQAREIGCKKLAFVGTPCQVQAMRKYQVYSNIFEDLWGSIEYVIGIFCMETFAYNNVVKIAEEFCKTPIANVSKMDINKGKFFVYDLEKNSIEVPIKEVTSLARHACHYCVDLTNELADISCGSIGSGPGWSTVVVRSEKGEKLYKAALQENFFQVKDIPADKPFGIPLIEKLANGKRKRNFKGLLKIVDTAPIYYYDSLKQILKVEEE
ncbi:MAG: Coenzyme F420 hydrogenase/dehydrogenase, beta subunit C-terminal domain [Candidatus Helarchaeota archaeon]